MQKLFNLGFSFVHHNYGSCFKVCLISLIFHIFKDLFCCLLFLLVLDHVSSFFVSSYICLHVDSVYEKLLGVLFGRPGHWIHPLEKILNLLLPVAISEHYQAKTILTHSKFQVLMNHRKLCYKPLQRNGIFQLFSSSKRGMARSKLHRKRNLTWISFHWIIYFGYCSVCICINT